MAGKIKILNDWFCECPASGCRIVVYEEIRTVISRLQVVNNNAKTYFSVMSVTYKFVASRIGVDPAAFPGSTVDNPNATITQQVSPC